MAARLKARPELLDRRREIVEHPFGSIMQWMNQGAFLMRGLANVRGEFSLTALVYSLRRVLNILGVGAMIAAVRGGREAASVDQTRGVSLRGLQAATLWQAVTARSHTVCTWLCTGLR